MQEINAVVVRLEKALANQFLDIPPSNLSILEYLASKGIRIGLSSRSSTAKLLSYLERKNIRHLFSFLIGSYGAEYLNLETGQKTVMKTFSAEQIKEAARAVSSLPVSCGVWNGRGFTFDKPGLFGCWYAVRRLKPFRTNGLDSLNPDWVSPKILVTGSKALLARISSRFDGLEVRCIPYTERITDVIPKQNDPWREMQHAIRDFDLKPENILSFSSSKADLELMDHTFAVAMKNSDPDIQKHAKHITKYTGAQNGISYAVNALILEKACVFKKPDRKDTE